MAIHGFCFDALSFLTVHGLFVVLFSSLCCIYFLSPCLSRCLAKNFHGPRFVFSIPILFFPFLVDTIQIKGIFSSPILRALAKRISRVARNLVACFFFVFCHFHPKNHLLSCVCGACGVSFSQLEQKAKCWSRFRFRCWGGYGGRSSCLVFFFFGPLFMSSSYVLLSFLG